MVTEDLQVGGRRRCVDIGRRRAARATTRSRRWPKTVASKSDGQHVGRRPAAPSDARAPRTSKMTCYACHSVVDDELLRLPPARSRPTRRGRSCTTKATRPATRRPTTSRSLRDDVFMLGRDGTVTGNRIAPVRSSCAIIVSSQDLNRQWIYSSSRRSRPRATAGMPSTRTCRTPCARRRPRRCTDCHVSAEGDNNAGWRSSCCRAPTS